MLALLARYRHWVMAALVMYWLAIFTGTHLPRIPDALETGASDKTLHYIAYCGLAFLLSARRSCTTAWTFKGAGLILAIAAVYGICDELTQIPVGRDASIYDWFADMIGTGSGIAVFSLFWKFVTKRKMDESLNH